LTFHVRIHSILTLRVGIHSILTFRVGIRLTFTFHLRNHSILTLRVEVRLTSASRVRIQIVGGASGNLARVVRGGAENMDLLEMLLLGIAANYWRLRVIMEEMTGCHGRAARSIAWDCFPPGWVDECRRRICQKYGLGNCVAIRITLSRILTQKTGANNALDCTCDIGGYL
jgi:hypothetical protein